MHDNFVDWYRFAAVQASGETLERRWEGIEKFADGIDRTKVLDLVRIFLEKAAAGPLVEEFKGTFKDADSTFSLRDSQVELRVLAGATLLHIFADSGSYNLKDTAALALASALCNGSYGKILNEDVATEANRYLAAEAVRARKADISPITEWSGKDFDKILTELKTALETNNWASISEPLLNALRKLQQTTAGFTQEGSTAFQDCSVMVNAQKEESDVLWWLVGEHSDDIGVPVRSLKYPGVCLVLAKELSDLTLTLPCLYGTEAFLHKALRLGGFSLTKNVNFSDVINSAPDEWKASVLLAEADRELEDLCPIHCAIRKSQETGNSESWVPLFEKATGISNSKRLKPSRMALQYYYERMLIRALGD